MSIQIYIEGDARTGVCEFELDMANMNARQLLDAVGIGCDGGAGECHPGDILCGLEKREEVIRNTMREPWSAKNFVVSGIDLERATYYVNQLEKIAREALRRKKNVVWS